MNPSLFKTYDIRGIYPAEINEEVAAEVVRGCTVLFPRGKIIVGRDVRIGSPELAKSLVENLLLNPEYEVIDIGVCSTPLFYFAVNALGAAGGIMVTASHNPAEWNGFKVVGPGAAMTGGRAVLEAIQKAGPAGSGGGRYETRDMAPRYGAFFAEKFDFKKPLSVVCDFGNGSVGPVFSSIAPHFRNITFRVLNEISDGRFPSRSPNPLTPGALERLKNEVRNTKADLGVAFDADGDRAFFVDAHGEEIPPYVIASLLTDGGTKTLVAEVQVFHLLKSIGYEGALWESRVGTYFVKNMMRETGADLGAEYSGHYYFKEFFGADSGIFALLGLLRVVSRLPLPFSELLKTVPECHTAEWNVRVDDPNASLRGISVEYEKRNEFEKDVTDGVAFVSKERLFGVRPSNTEPLLRFFAAAHSEELLDDLVRELKSKTGTGMW